MRKFFLLLGVIAACFLAGVAVSCRKPSCSGNYYGVIPATSRIVCAVNVNQLMEKGELGKLLQSCMDNGYRSGWEGASVEKLNEILKDGEASGIDLSAYVFAVADSVEGQVALVAKVADIARLKEVFSCVEKERECTPLVTQGGYCETVISGEVFCIFNSEVLICATSSRLEQARQYAARMLARREKNIFEIPCFGKMPEGKNDIELLVSMQELPESVKNNIVAYMGGSDFDLNGIYATGSLNFEEGKIALEYALAAADPAVVDAWEKQGSQVEKVSGRLLAYYPAATLFYTIFNCQGGKINGLLEKNNSWRNMPVRDSVVAKRVLASLSGDVVCGVIDLSPMGVPDVLGYAQVNDSYPADLLADWLKKGFGYWGVLTEKGNHRYEFSIPMMDFYFGVKGGNLFYVTNNQEASRNIGKAVENPLGGTVAASDLKGSFGGMVLNVEGLLQSPVVSLMLHQLVGYRQGNLLQEALAEFSSVEMLVTSPYGVKGNIYMKNKGQNSLKTLAEIGKEWAVTK